jgi:hypothetical protein
MSPKHNVQIVSLAGRAVQDVDNLSQAVVLRLDFCAALHIDLQRFNAVAMAYNNTNFPGAMNDHESDKKSLESPERNHDSNLQNVRTNEVGEVIDPYGGKKLGMVRVRVPPFIQTWGTPLILTLDTRPP